MINKIQPINEEIRFEENEIIVSKTDLKGKIVYVNDVFCRVAEMSTSEVLDKPHNIIRHPEMPRCIFKLLWDTLTSGSEIFAYVKNMSKTGKYYWVIAHVTPSYDTNGHVNGYHSTRRMPTKKAVSEISEIYNSLIREEQKHSNPRVGLEASYEVLESLLNETGKTYSEFVWSIGEK